jgi:hypothetical protein
MRRLVGPAPDPPSPAAGRRLPVAVGSASDTESFMEAPAARIRPSETRTSRLKSYFGGPDPDPARSRPLPLGLCKQEVTGSIPVGSM